MSIPRKSIGSMMHINPTYWRQAGTAINFQLEMNFYNRSTSRIDHRRNRRYRACTAVAFARQGARVVSGRQETEGKESVALIEKAGGEGSAQY
jgi:hypothetical protein